MINYRNRTTNVSALVRMQEPTADICLQIQETTPKNTSIIWFNIFIESMFFLL